MNKIASVIIPVYNKEKYIHECLDSLIKQTCGIEKIEVICINDGSTDDSEKIIKEYSGKYDSINLVNQENAGVGAARNKGLAQATADYIFFLDADDMLSENAIEDVVSFFSKNIDKTDIVTYPLYYVDKNGENGRENQRGKDFKKNQIIYIRENPDFAQTTMNICIRNNDGMSLFNTEMKVAEDQLFNIERVFNSKSIGWCNSAKYLYRRNVGGISKFSHPYYTYYPLISVYKKMLRMAGDDKECLRYASGLILSNFSWRIRSDWFFAYHFKGEEKYKADKEIIELINKIDSEAIVKSKWLNNEFKTFLLSLKNNGEIKTSINSVCWSVSDDNGVLLTGMTVDIVFRRIGIRDGNLYGMAFLNSPIFNFLDDKPKLKILINDNSHEEELFDSLNSMRGTKIKTNKSWGFFFNMRVAEDDEIKFKVVLNGFSFNTNLRFREWTALHNNRFAFFNPLSIENVLQALIIRKFSSIKNAYKKWKGGLKKRKLKFFFRRWLIPKLMKKRIWIYNDFQNTFDNGWLQFIHDSKINDGVLRFYAYFGDKRDYIKKLGNDSKGRLIKHGGSFHKLLFPAAEKILTSYAGTGQFCPFSSSQWDDFNGFNNPSVIYLQHGVMHAKADNLYAKDRSPFIDKIVASTDFEVEYFKNVLNYDDSSIIKTGMPRFNVDDNIEIKKSKSKRILFAPSWREYLVSRDGNNWKKVSDFLESDYYINMSAFLNNPRLIDLLDKKGFDLDIKLHPNFIEYTDFFRKITSNRVHLVDVIDYSYYRLLITDFSSFLFDFLYRDIPVVSFIPDETQFSAGLHSYRSFIVDLEKNGIKKCSTIEDLLNCIEIYISPDFKFHSEINFYNKEHNASDDLYNVLIKDMIHIF